MVQSDELVADSGRCEHPEVGEEQGYVLSRGEIDGQVEVLEVPGCAARAVGGWGGWVGGEGKEMSQLAGVG